VGLSDSSRIERKDAHRVTAGRGLKLKKSAPDEASERGQDLGRVTVFFDSREGNQTVTRAVKRSASSLAIEVKASPKRVETTKRLRRSRSPPVSRSEYSSNREGNRGRDRDLESSRRPRRSRSPQLRGRQGSIREVTNAQARSRIEESRRRNRRTDSRLREPSPKSRIPRNPPALRGIRRHDEGRFGRLDRQSPPRRRTSRSRERPSREISNISRNSRPQPVPRRTRRLSPRGRVSPTPRPHNIPLRTGHRLSPRRRESSPLTNERRYRMRLSSQHPDDRHISMERSFVGDLADRPRGEIRQDRRILSNGGTEVERVRDSRSWVPREREMPLQNKLSRSPHFDGRQRIPLIPPKFDEMRRDGEYIEYRRESTSMRGGRLPPQTKELIQSNYSRDVRRSHSFSDASYRGISEVHDMSPKSRSNTAPATRRGFSVKERKHGIRYFAARLDSLEALRQSREKKLWKANWSYVELWEKAFMESARVILFFLRQLGSSSDFQICGYATMRSVIGRESGTLKIRWESTKTIEVDGLHYYTKSRRNFSQCKDGEEIAKDGGIRLLSTFKAYDSAAKPADAEKIVIDLG